MSRVFGLGMTGLTTNKKYIFSGIRDKCGNWFSNLYFRCRPGQISILSNQVSHMCSKNAFLKTVCKIFLLISLIPKIICFELNKCEIWGTCLYVAWLKKLVA